MYKAVPKIYGSLFDIINDEFGKEGRGYIATFEKECMPRRGSDLLPELFPWAYLHISKTGQTAYRRHVLPQWTASVVSSDPVGGCYWHEQRWRHRTTDSQPRLRWRSETSRAGAGKHRGRRDAVYVYQPPNACHSLTRRIVRSPDGMPMALRSQTTPLSVKRHRRRNTTTWRNTSRHGRSILTST